MTTYALVLAEKMNLRLAPLLFLRIPQYSMCVWLSARLPELYGKLAMRSATQMKRNPKIMNVLSIWKQEKLELGTNQRVGGHGY